MKVINLYPRRWPRWVRISLRILAGILLLLLLLLALIQSDWGQRYLTRQVQGTLEKKLNTRVSLARISLKGFNRLGIYKLTVFDQNDQVLLHSDSLTVRFALMPLLSSKVNIYSLEWKKLVAQVYTQPDNRLNYQFILDALASSDSVSGNQTDPPQNANMEAAESGGWEINLGRIRLENIYLLYNDVPAGINAALQLKNLNARFRETDLAKGRYSLNELQVSGLTGFYDQAYRRDSTALAGNDASNSGKPNADTTTGMDIRSKLLQLEDIHFAYSDEGSGIRTGWQVAAAKLELIRADLANNRYTAGNLQLDAPEGYLMSRKGLDTVEKAVTQSYPPLQVQVKTFAIRDAVYGMQNLEEKRSRYRGAIDFNYLGIRLRDGSFSSVHWEDDSLKAEIKSLAVREKSGFELQQANGSVRYNPEKILLDKYYLKTGRSLLSNSLEITLPKDDSGKIQTDRIGINASFPQAALTVAEALYFAPELEEDTALARLWDKQLFLSGRISGNLQNLLLAQFRARDNVGNDINLQGTLRNLTDPNRLGAELGKIDIRSGKESILAWLSPHQLPSNIELAEAIHLTGRLNGTMKKFNTDLNLNSSFGIMKASGQIANLDSKQNASYALDLREFDMDAGRWIKDSTIGRININGKLKGQGLDPQTMKTNLDLAIREAAWNGYNYQNIGVKGELNQGQYKALVESRDSNLLATVDLSGAIQDSSLPTIKGKITVDRADLYKVGLSTQPMIVKGLFELDLRSTAPRELDGDVLIHQVQYADAEKQYQLDSINLIARKDSGIQSIMLESPFGEASLRGDYDYTQLANTVSGLISYHLEKDYENKKKYNDSTGRQQAVLQASLIVPKSLKDLVSDLDMSKPLLISGRINTDSSMFYVFARQPQLRYGTATIDSARILLYAGQDSLQFFASVRAVDHPSLPLNKTRFSGSGSDGRINWNFEAANKEGKKSYDVGGRLDVKNKNEFSLSLNPELLLNKTTFTTNEGNSVVIKNGALDDAELVISSGSQSIELKHSNEDSAQANTYFLTIKDFQGSTISSFVSKDTSLVDGLINAQLQYRADPGDTSLTGDLKIDSLHVFAKPVGALEAKFSKEGTDIGVDAKLTENGNNVLIKGTYGEALNATIKLDSLQMATIEPFSFGSLTEMHGALTGDLTVSGEITQPEFSGDLHFHQANMRVSYLNNPILLDQQTISFRQDAIQLNNFTLQDSAGGKAIFNGVVSLEELTNPGFDLKLNASNFQVLGPKVNDEQMIWGPAKITTQTTIGGNLTLPKVDMQLKLMDKSAVGFVVPEDEPGIVNREGVIVFVNRANPVDSSLLNKDQKGSKATGFSGMEFSANVEITPASTLTIVIDPYNGDFLEVKGNTSLQVDIDQSNNISMSGAYEIEEGKYEMSLSQLIKRSFQIEKGSTIVWNGDPLDATIDISAKNQVMAPAIDLIRDQSAVSRTELNMARQKVPVDVYMDISGRLMAPQINFRLDMPEKDRNMFNGAVYTRIKQINTIESELTRQVMSLLVLQTFMSENPLASLENRNEGGLGFTAKQSVSKILSQQMNNLAGSLISGIDLNFDLKTQEDYMSGSRQESTVLNVGASKTLLNDRLTVSVGSNIGLMGEQPQGNAHLIGDVLIDYKLSRDGRYRLRAYQRNQTDAILLGQIVETGVSFILVMDFDQFREIFHRAKKQQQGKQP